MSLYVVCDVTDENQVVALMPPVRVNSIWHYICPKDKLDDVVARERVNE